MYSRSQRGSGGVYTESVCVTVCLSICPSLLLPLSHFIHFSLSPSFFLPSPLVLPSFIPHPTTSGATFLSPPFRPFILDSKHSPNFRIPYDTR